MAEKNNIAMFKQINGERVQIGWASPVDPDTGGRTIERIAAYGSEVLTDLSFEDDPDTMVTAAEHEGRASSEIIVTPTTTVEEPEEVEEEQEPLPAEPEDAGRDTEQDAEPETVAPDVPEEILEDDTDDEENN